MRTRADTTTRTVELDLESALLRVADHVGVFYRGDAERDAFVVPLIGAAVAAGCGVIYVCDRSTPCQVAEQLEGAEPDVAEAVARDQVRIVPSCEVYLAGGRFDPERTVGFYADGLARCVRDGYPVTCVIGEGGSGGALAIGVCDRLLMLQYSVYSVISPEGCASILWKSADRRELAAEAMGITAQRLSRLELVDEVIPEPLGGAHRDPQAMAESLREALVRRLAELTALPADVLLAERQRRLRGFGVFGGA